MNTTDKQATLADLAWMVGPWQGGLGTQTVAEDWSIPLGGCMSTMVRLCSAQTVDMIELIAIREVDNSLLLHLRQFTPELTIVRDQNMPLAWITGDGVKFDAPGEGIEGLAYHKQDNGGMRVEVTVAGGAVLAASLQRP